MRISTTESCIGISYLLIVVFAIALAIGWLMNFQNLWEYWPASGSFADVPMQWIISVIGIFAAPLGCVTGWIF